jgi:K+-transporting ATPase ATPase A chain
VDLWRSVVYVLVPLSFISAVLLIAAGVPMTLEGNAQVSTLEPGAMGTGADGQPTLFQLLARGPVAAILAIKQLGTNGGGFFGANCTHPFENPTDWANILTCLSLILIPVSQLVMFGRMLKDLRHAAVIFGVMLFFSAITIAWGIYFDSMHPNPALTAHPAQTYEIPDATSQGGRRILNLPALAGLPVDQSLGNLEGKELRFGTSAGPTWAAFTTNTSNGSVNCMHDSLNPLAGLPPLVGMWLNCIWGGVGVGLINFFIYLIVGVFLAGLMVGRTPEYLGKKVEGREMNSPCWRS